jgi:DNA processing protein
MSHPQAQFKPEHLLGPLNEVERKNAPNWLYLAGDADLLRHGSRISIVGSRQASPEGLELARRIVTVLVGNGVTIVSGLAAGIDTISHQTAISEGGRTIAVLGTPLDKVYPMENRGLQDSIMRDHLAVSQFRPGYPSQRKNWPIRNRTMALLSDATVIVEAREKSGTLHQGWEALRLGRSLFLAESVGKDPDLSWPQEMIRYGAQVLREKDLEMILEAIPQRTSSVPVAF